MSDGNSALVNLKAALGEIATKANENPDAAHTELQGVIYQAIADDDEHAEKLGIDADKLRRLLGDANHQLVLTGDAGTVINNLLAGLKK
ncbi:hypothetical protein [Tsukamurella tyrosinosolvens]|uniref:hypothetical protein n=1 Tax=Tsukamurella tyrosinosolvens TaxID=57704 RepID=UPI0011467400|nr:hypothetical protein [Tsukamurella tyrosinosolvens]